MRTSAAGERNFPQGQLRQSVQHQPGRPTVLANDAVMVGPALAYTYMRTPSSPGRQSDDHEHHVPSKTCSWRSKMRISTTPELELTLSEARRRFGIDSQTCRGLLGCAREYAACSCALTRAVTSGSSQGWPAGPNRSAVTIDAAGGRTRCRSCRRDRSHIRTAGGRP